MEILIMITIKDMKEVELLAMCVNRRLQQEEYLFELCGNDSFKLLHLEAQIKKHFIAYCPSDKESVEHILSLK